MADLKILGRQVAQPNAPDLSGAGEARGNLGAAISHTSKTITTAIDSANKIEAELQYTEASNILNRELVNSLSNENLSKGQAYSRYVENANAIKEGVLTNVPRRYHSDVKNLIDKEINKLSLKVAAQELSFKEAQNKAEGQVILANQYKELEEAAATGDMVGLQNAEENIDLTVGRLEDIGAFDAVDTYKAKERVQKTRIKSFYASQYEGLLRQNPEAADVFLRQIAEKKPDNLTHEEWQEVNSSLLKQRTEFRQLVNASETLGQDEFQLEFDSGRITSPDELNDFVAQKEAEGRYFSPNDKLNMLDALVRAQKQESSEIDKVIEIDNALSSSPDAIYDYSTSDQNKYYQAKSELLEQQFAEQKAINPDAPVPSRLAIRASVAAKLPVAVESFNREFGDKLQYGTIGDMEEAIKVGEHLLEKAPKTFSQLPKESQVYQDLASTLYGNTKLPPEQIRELVNKTLAPRNEETQRKLDKSLADIHKTAYLKDLYKEVYGTKFVNPALQPQFNNLSKTYDAFYQISGDKNTAAKLTTNFMSVNSGKSEFIPKYDVTKNPIEATPLYQKSPIFVKNQIAIGAHEIVRNYEYASSQGYKMPFKVEWPDGVKPLDIHTVTEGELHDKNIWVNEKGKEIPPQLKIDGKNRKLFLMNPNTDLEDPTVDQRQYYFEDDYGNPWPLYVVEERDYENGLIDVNTGIPTIQFVPSNKLTPHVAAMHEEKEFQDQAVKHLREEFKTSEKIKTKNETEDNKLRRGIENQSKQALQGLPERPNPYQSVEAVNKVLEKRKEEDEFVAANLEKKVSELKESKKKQIEKLLAGES